MSVGTGVGSAALEALEQAARMRAAKKKTILA
jgi:hypothetical protein